MRLFDRKPIRGRLVRRMYRRSGLLFLPCDSFFCKDMPEGKPVLMLMDTGSTASCLRRDFIESMLPANEIRYSQGDSILTINGNVNADSLLWTPFIDSYGNRYREDFFVLDNADSLRAIEEETGLVVAGILGTWFMERHGITINFKRKEVVI